MLVELRRYQILPGQMDAMHARMSDMLLPLFREYGIPTPLAIWENRDETSILTWMVEWPDFETRQYAWARFAPVFAAARHAEGTPEFVTRTTLTVIAPWPGHDFQPSGGEAGCESAWHVQPRIGFGAGFVTGCEDVVFDHFRTAGAIGVRGCNLLFGALPQVMLIQSWPNPAARSAGMAQIAGETMPPPIAEALTGEGPLFGDRGDWETLDPAPYLAGWRNG